MRSGVGVFEMSAEYLIAHIGHTHKDCEHITWWKPDSRGYAYCIDRAGRYSEEDARKICKYPSTCLAVRVDDVQPLARTTPYYRNSKGDLLKLYDGESMRPVPNSKETWVGLIAKRLDCGNVDKPTPISVNKSRAIYLDSLLLHAIAKESA
jgi:hypothetical protein